MPELRHLRVFVAVAEQLSFTRAAELLNLTQQSVSRTVSELERELGVTLLERTTREVRLTAPGESPVLDGAEAVRAADVAFTRAREVGTGELGTVRVGVSPAIGPVDREDVVRALRPPGSAYTDLLLAAIDDAGARVEPVEARVTGGAALLLVLEDEVALMPAGTGVRSGLAAVPVDGFCVPLVLLWPAGLPAAAVARLRAALS